MDVGRNRWTLADRIIREFIHSRPAMSSAFALPTLRNQQVLGSLAISAFTGKTIEHKSATDAVCFVLQ
jgi:hypothetical protein